MTARTHALRPDVQACLADWTALVRANREQVERLREAAPPTDYYAPIATAFRADPTRADDDSLNALLEIAQPSETWLDVGAGGGRYALAVARRVRRVIAVEPSEAMRTVLREVQTEFAIDNVKVVAERWPLAESVSADVALIAHVGYDIEAIGPFLDGLEAAAPRRVAQLMERPPIATYAALCEQVHGEPLAIPPAAPELMTLLRARGQLPELRIVGCQRWRYETLDQVAGVCRRWLALRKGSEKDQRMQALLAPMLNERARGGLEFGGPSRICMIYW